jgi:hypothetical protein
MLLKETSKDAKSITNLAIDKATSKFLNKDIAKTLKARDIAKTLKVRDIAKYLKNKVRLVAEEGAIEGFEEVN